MNNKLPFYTKSILILLITLILKSIYDNIILNLYILSFLHLKLIILRIVSNRHSKADSICIIIIIIALDLSHSSLIWGNALCRQKI